VAHATRRREAAVSTKILANHGFQEIRILPANADNDDDNELAGASAIAEDVAETCTQAENLISEISTHVYNKVQEGSLTTTDVEDVLEGLKEIVNDLESCKCLLKM
jgi:hypothetical protein